MALYMTQISYTAEAVAAMIKNPQDRSVILQQLIEKLGGRLIGCYSCFGEYDGVFIADLPDPTTELALILAAISPGHVKTTKTTLLFTPEEAVAAMKKAGAQVYAGPEG